MKHLDRYLPPMVSGQAIEETAKKVIAELEATTSEDVNKVVEIVSTRLAGKALISDVTSIVQSILK